MLDGTAGRLPTHHPWQEHSEGGERSREAFRRLRRVVCGRCDVGERDLGDEGGSDEEGESRYEGRGRAKGITDDSPNWKKGTSE